MAARKSTAKTSNAASQADGVQSVKSEKPPSMEQRVSYLEGEIAKLNAKIYGNVE